MKRTLILLGLFLVLGGGTYFYLNQQPQNSSHSTEDYNLYIEDVNQIEKIFIADRKGETREVERNGDHWVYKGKRRVRATSIQTMLETLQRQRMKFIPPRAAVNTAVKAIAARGLKVEIYGKNDVLLKAFYVGGVTQDESGTYMIREGSEQPVVMHIPSWSGNLRGRYWGREVGWYDRVLFGYEKKDIKKLSIEYPRQKNKSFILENNDGKYDIKPFYKVTPVITSSYKQSSADEFLDGFKSLSAEAFRNEFSKRDSISKLVPFSIVTITDQSDQEYTVRFHPQDVKKGITNAVDVRKGLNTVGKDGYIERYFADCSNDDFMLVQHFVFGKIFWSYQAFFN